MVPARNSSWIGCSSGSLSISATGVIAGIVVAESSVWISSSSSSATRSPRICTCCFSSATEVTWVPARACRKNVRLPGSPTVPGTKRSGGSKRWMTGMRKSLWRSSQTGPAPPPTTASLERVRRLRGLLARWASEPALEFMVSTKARCGV